MSRQEFPFYRKFPPKLCLNIQDKATIISHHFKFSYTRISKAVNSTIVASLYNTENSKVVDTLPEVQQIKDNHYNRLSSLNKEQVRLLMDTYYKITFVRNPSIRILSAYLDKVVQNKGGKGDFVAQFLDKPIGSNISFDEFLSYLDLGGVNPNAHWARQIDMLPLL